MSRQMPSTMRLFVIGACLMLAPAPAASQEAAPPPPPPAGESAEFGFQMPGWSFTPSVAIGLLHDSNVALSSPRADRGVTQGDSLFTMVPGGELAYDGKLTDFSLSYRGFLRRHLQVTGLDGFNHRGSAGFRHALSRRWSTFARTNLAETPTTDEVEVNGVPFRRMGSRTSMTAVGTSVQLTKLTTLAARYDMTWVSFERPDEFLQGGWIHGVRTDASRRLSRRLALGGEYGYRWASLENQQREVTFQDAGAVLRYEVGPHTSASVATGLGVLYDRNADDRRSGPYVRFGLAHDLAYMRLGASFDRQYVPSFGFGGATSSQQMRGYAQVPLGLLGWRRASLQGSAAWRRTTPFEETTLEADTVWVRSGLGVMVTRRSRVETLYTYTRQDSIVTGGEVDRHRVGVQFVISQPMRIQ